MKAHTDALTGLPGRPEFETAIEQAMREGDGCALGMIDIDYFLDVNTQFGHDVGDRLLKTLAEIIQETAPGNSYRISGDEFAVVLPDVGLEQGFLRLEALRANVHAARDRFALPDQREVTVTIGVAQYPRDAKDVQGLISAVDAALYGAKENGRNQVGLPQTEEMVMKSCYYPVSSVRKLRTLSERLNRKESRLLREALDDLFRKYDTPR